MNERIKKPTKAPLPANLSAKLRASIRSLGEDSVANALGMSGQTIGRAAGGLGVEAGTRARVELWAARMDAEVSRATPGDGDNHG